MWNRVQLRNESINSYYHEKMKLCDEVGFNFEDTREQVIIGLWSRELRTQVSSKSHRNEDDFLHDLLQQQWIIDQSYEKRTLRDGFLKLKTTCAYKDIDNVGSSGHIANMEKDAGNYRNPNLTAARSIPSRNEKGEPKCYNCNVYGHSILQFEPSKRGCFGARETRKGSEISSSQSLSLSLPRSRDNGCHFKLLT